VVPDAVNLVNRAIVLLEQAHPQVKNLSRIPVAAQADKGEKHDAKERPNPENGAD
jgi:hypothetical protein